MGISVIFPAYNEEGNIERTMRLSLEALRDQFEEFEIIVINDASLDRTGEIADRIGADVPEMRVVHNPVNLGQGQTLVKGFKLARHDLILHNAMDYPFDLRDLPKLLCHLDKADVVVASRTHRPGYTLYRRICSFANTNLLNLLFGMALRDYNFVQLYRHEVLDRVPMTFRSTAFLTPSILIGAHDMGFRIYDVLIDYHPRTSGKPTSGSLRVIYSSVRDMLKCWLTRRRYDN